MENGSAQQKGIKYGVLVALALFVLLAVCRMGFPLGQDEISHYYKVARILFFDGYSHPEDLIVFSPHLYPLACWGVTELVGVFRPWAVQLTGILCWLGCLFSLWRLSFDRRDASIACALCLTMPAVLQASVTIEIDQAMLPLLVLLLCWSFDRACSGKLGWHWVSLLFGLSLWCRPTTPVVLVPVLLVYAGLRVGSRRDVIKPAIALLAGFLLFLGTWSLYGLLTGVRWQGVFHYLCRSFTETTVGERSSGLGRIVQSMIYLIFWGLNPFLLCWLLQSFVFVVNRYRHAGYLAPGSLYGLCAIWLLLGYSLVGGSLFGFPKYQISGIPLLCAFVTMVNPPDFSWHDRVKDRVAVCCFIVLCVLAGCFGLGDPLEVMRVEVRDLACQGEGIKGVLLGMAVRCALVWLAVALFILWLVLRKKITLATALFLAAISLNAGFALRQTAGGYCTGYVYGDRGETKQVAKILAKATDKPEQAIAPHEVLFYLDDFKLVNDVPEVFSKAEDLQAALRDRKPPVVATSPLVSTVANVSLLLSNPEIREILDAEYEYQKVGRYYVWTRKSVDP